MFLLPLLVLVVIGVVVYRLVHRQPHAAVGAREGVGTVTVPHGSFWPTSTPGRFGIAVFAASLALQALVNVLQVPFLGAILLPAAFVLTGVARFRMHDRSTAVLIVFVIAAVATLFAVLFFAGEIFIGHD